MKKSSVSPKSMNKQALVASVSKLSGLPRDESRKALNAVMESVTTSLKDGNDVRLPGFGTFRIHLRPETDGRNPRTGKPIKIPARKIPKFRPSLKFKDEVA